MINFYFRMKSRVKQSYALIIDGISLETITLNKKQNDFRLIAVKCDAVLCCRMSPSQKANVNYQKNDLFNSKFSLNKDCFVDKKW